MGKSRIDLAMEFLVKAQKLGRKAKRDYVIQAVRHLIAWLSGDEKLPDSNAVNTDDDASTYCDVCFSPRLRIGEDVCKRCNPPNETSPYPLSEEQRMVREVEAIERIQPELDRHEEREKRWKR